MTEKNGSDEKNRSGKVFTMKTIDEFIKEIEGSVALQDEIRTINDKDALAAFLKKNDVDGTVEDFGKAIQAKAEAEGELSDEAAEAVAGGGLGGWFRQWFGLDLW